MESPITEDNLFSFLETWPVPMLLLNRDTNIVLANHAALQLTGSDDIVKANPRPGNALNCIHSAGDPRGCGYSPDCPFCPIRNQLESLMAGGTPISGMEVTLTLLRNGLLVPTWLELHAQTVSLHGESHLCVSFTDITDRKLTTERLALSESIFRGTFDHSPVGSVMVGLDKRFLRCNNTFTAFLGYTEQELAGRLISDVTHPEDQMVGMEEMRQMVEGHLGKTSAQKRYIRKDGAIVWGQITINLIRNTDHSPFCFLAVINDITDLKRATNELLKKDELLGITGTTAKVGGWEFDTETMRQTWTDEVYRIHELDFSFDPDVNNGLGFYEPKSREIISAAVDRTMRFGEPFDLELEFFTANGKHRWVHTIGKALQQNGKTVKVYGSFQDITEKKEIEEQILHHNERLQKLNATRDRFFSIIAHDLRNPFNSFLGLTNLMADDTSELSVRELRDLAGRLNSSAENLYRLLDNLLQWARIQQGSFPMRPEKINLSATIADVCDLLSEQAGLKNIRLLNGVKSELLIQTDPQMVRTILSNVVSNAIKFTPDGGKVEVSVREDGPEFIEVSVSDSGIGISPEIMDNLFNMDIPTSRRGTGNEPGTGLGLLLCKDLMKMLGGRIAVESSSGQGSIFRLAFPTGKS